MIPQKNRAQTLTSPTLPVLLGYTILVPSSVQSSAAFWRWPKACWQRLPAINGIWTSNHISMGKTEAIYSRFVHFRQMKIMNNFERICWFIIIHHYPCTCWIYPKRSQWIYPCWSCNGREGPLWSSCNPHATLSATTQEPSSEGVFCAPSPSGSAETWQHYGALPAWEWEMGLWS